MSSPVINRESRHVLVTGLPDVITEEKLSQFFSGFGRVQKIERCANGVVVSFADVRSALKAHNGDHRLETGHLFRLSYFYEVSPTAKNPLSISKPDSASPRIADGKTTSSSPRSIKEIRGQRPANAPSKRSAMRPEHLRKDGRPDSSSSGSPCSSGLSGFYVESIPRGDSVRNAIGDAFKKFGKLAYVVLENGNSPDDRRALVIFNSVSERLVDKSVMIMGQRCRVRQAETMDVQMAYNRQLAATSVMAASTSRDGYGGGRDEVNVYSENASRTLYVGGLESNPTEASLRRRFEKFGVILDLDVKNPESPSPFAFLQFADIDSAVRAINAHRQNPTGVKKLKVNFGRLQVSSRLWIGSIPASAPEDYVKQKLKAFLDGAVDIFYDTNIHQAIVTFGSNEHATRGHDKIRNGICQLKCDGQESRLSVDYCSERLLNFFLDRKHQQAGSYLSPPPNPPADMPSYPSNGYRHDHYRDSNRRNSPSSYSRRHERSRSRDRSERSRSRHIPSKYERKRSRDDHRRRRESSDSSSSHSSSSGSSASSKRSSSRSRSEYSSPEQYKSSKSGSRREERRDRERTERKQHRKRPSVESPAAVVEKVEEVPPRRPVERVEGQGPQERAQSGDSGFSEEQQQQRGTLEPPPAPPPLDVAVAKPPPPIGPPSHPHPVRQSTSSHHATPSHRREEHRSHHEPQASSSHHHPHQQQQQPQQGPHSGHNNPHPGHSGHSHDPHHHHGQPQHHQGHPQQHQQQRHHPDARPHQQHPQPGAVRPHYPHEHIAKRPSFDGHTMRDHYGNDVMNRHEQRQHHLPLPYSYYDNGGTRAHGANNFAPKDALYSYPTNWPFSILHTNRPLRIPYSPVAGAQLSDPRKRRPHKDYNRNMTYRPEWEDWLELPMYNKVKVDKRLNNEPDKERAAVVAKMVKNKCMQDLGKVLVERLDEEKQFIRMHPGHYAKTGRIGWYIWEPPKKKEDPGQVSKSGSQDDPQQQQQQQHHQQLPPQPGHSSQHQHAPPQHQQQPQHHHQPSGSGRTPPPQDQQVQPGTSQHVVVPTTPNQAPTTPASGHGGEEEARSSRSNSQSNWMPSTGREAFPPAHSFKTNFAEKMLRLKDKYHGKPLGLGNSYGSSGANSATSTPVHNATPTSSGNFSAPPPVAPPSSRPTFDRHNPSLQISIPPIGSNFPGTPNSAKSSDFSPRVENVRKTVSALPANSRQPFTPGMGGGPPVSFPPNVNIPPPTFAPEHQQPSPILSAPPPPPQLPPIRTDMAAAGLKSPPVTPGSTCSSKYGAPSSAASPSIMASRTPIHDYSKVKEPQPIHTTPRAVQASSRHPSMSGMPKPPQERTPHEREPRPPPLIQHRHDSMSALRSPPTQPTASMVARSQSMSDSKKTAANKDTADLLCHLFDPNRSVPTPMSSMKSFKIEKKTQPPPPQQVEKHQEKEKSHKKEKEHKQRRKEDGSLETKEERAKRKEMERAAKEKLKRKKEKREKLERKRSKEGTEEKERKKHKKEKREKEEKKAKKKKKKHHKQSSDEEENSEDSEEEGYQKSFMRQQYQSDHQLAMALAGQSMYDRVKRRSSAATKDEAKKSALQALREKNQKRRGRVQLDSSDEDESSQQRGSDDNSSDDNEPARKTESNESGREEETEVHKIKRKKLKPIKEASKEERGSSDSDSEHEHRKHKKAKKKEKQGKKSAFAADSDIFGANSSEDEQVAKKKLLSTSDESDHPKKMQKIDFHDLFGSDNVEKKAKKEKRDKSPKHHRKRHLSGTGDESVAKRSKRGSFGSEMSSDAEAVLAKLQELQDEQPKKHQQPQLEEVVVEEAQVPSCSIFTAPIVDPIPHPPMAAPKEDHHLHQSERPKLVTKAAMKVFEPAAAALPPVPQSIVEREVDSDDSAAHDYPHSRDSSSSSEASDEEAAAPPPQCLTPPPQEEQPQPEEEEDMEEGELLEDEEEEEPEAEQMDVCPAPPPQPVLEPEPEPQPEVEEEPQPEEEEESEQAVLSIQQETHNAVASISLFDFEEDDAEPQYPSHDYIHNEEAVLIDPIPVEISEDQIMAESLVEEPMPVEEEVEDDRKKSCHQHLEEGQVNDETEEEEEETKPAPEESPLYLQEPEQAKEELPSPKGPLSVCVDPLPPSAAPLPSSSSFSASAESLTSPRLPATPQSAPVAPSPLASPAVPAASPAGPSPRAAAPQQPSPVASPAALKIRRLQEEINNIDMQLRVTRAEIFGQGDPFKAHVDNLENLRRRYVQEIQNIRQPTALLPPPLQQQQQLSEAPAPNGLLDPSSKTPFLKRMPSVWRGKIVIKNSTEVAVQMHMMCGEKDYVTGALGPLAAGMRTKSGGEPSLRILQRMRAEGQALYSLLMRLQTSGSTCLCMPIGNNKEEMKQHSVVMKQAFSDYFVRKGCAGIVSVDATETTPASLIYVFPPNEFTDAYLQECSPELLSKLKNKESEDFCYLFVAIAPAVLSPQQD